MFSMFKMSIFKMFVPDYVNIKDNIKISVKSYKQHILCGWYFTVYFRSTSLISPDTEGIWKVQYALG